MRTVLTVAGCLLALWLTPWPYTIIVAALAGVFLTLAEADWHESRRRAR